MSVLCGPRCTKPSSTSSLAAGVEHESDPPNCRRRLRRRAAQLGQRPPVTVSYQFLSGTAIAGQDFTGPYTGSATIQPNFPQAWVSVPVVNDGITEPTESLSLRVTSGSQKANIGPRTTP